MLCNSIKHAPRRHACAYLGGHGFQARRVQFWGTRPADRKQALPDTFENEDIQWTSLTKRPPTPKQWSILLPWDHGGVWPTKTLWLIAYDNDDNRVEGSARRRIPYIQQIAPEYLRTDAAGGS